MSLAITRTTATLGPYQVLADLGAVPWGTAHAAIDFRSDREVMLVVVPSSRRGWTEGEVPWEVLLAETVALERLYHPGIPVLFEVAEHEGEILIAFAVTPGRTLDEALRAGLKPDRGQLADWGCQLLDALAEAHAHGLLHRHLGEGEPSATELIYTPPGTGRTSRDEDVRSKPVFRGRNLHTILSQAFASILVAFDHA